MFLFDNAISMPARIVGMIEADVPIVHLDRTIFHPTTGSQRADRGCIGSAQVLAVAFDGGEISHYVNSSNGLEVGAEITLQLDQDWRHLQSAYHSAGHLIASAMRQIDQRCTVLFGQHYPDQAALTLHSANQIKEGHIKELNDLLQHFIEQNLIVDIGLESGTRYVRFGGLEAIPCNGTHVDTTGELEKIDVIRHEYDGERLRLYYVTYNRT
ncbi:hypothetical protein DW352_03475 [Pseudolabrys taiwanensis]|uniref:Alanyl-tRNA editing protein n=1 Tax=Pseudolabrys taiwanensis TaxID=331696 RepID=A0A345ZRW2_9HYPH|nr:hypothetical protein [Pseudolabrys taiwanensis]AXK79659.1 hypothetical protein DW352_03475 [Pseudolabrys taiwanensis]